MEPQTEPALKLKELCKEIVNRSEGPIQSGGYITVSELVHMFVLARQVLEKEKLKDEFEILSLYCDWCLHVKLDQRRAKRFLQSIYAGFLKQNDPTMKKREDALLQLSFSISESLSLEVLKGEMVELFKRCGFVVNGFGDVGNWHNISGHIFKIMLGNVLEIPNVEKVVGDKQIYVNMLKELGAAELKTIKFWTERNEFNMSAPGWVLQFNDCKPLKGSLFNMEKLRE